jgi:hypothetical protein
MKYLLLMSVAALSVGLVGCGGSTSAEGDSSAPLCLDTAKPFEYPVSTFVVNENLDRSSSWDYLKGIQYVSGGTMPEDNIRAIIVLMEDKVNEFVVYDGVAATGITSLNNAIDTMEEVVAAEDTAGNIQNGKIQMEGAIRDGVTCSYNNKAAVLRDSGNADPDTNLLFYILDYSYTSGTNRLARTIAHYKEVTELDEDGEEKTTNEILSTSLSALNPDTFVTSGYNAPLASTSQWGDSESSLTITKDYQERTDRAAYVSATKFTVGSNTEVKRFKISVDYDNNYEAKIYTSDFVSAVTCHPGTDAAKELFDPTVDELKANNCENLEDREPLRDSGYDITDIDPEIPGSGTEPMALEAYTATPVDGR